MPKRRFQFILFDLAMTVAEVRETIKPYDPAQIERTENEGLVCFDGGEKGAMRRRFIEWDNQFGQQRKE